MLQMMALGSTKLPVPPLVVLFNRTGAGGTSPYIPRLVQQQLAFDFVAESRRYSAKTPHQMLHHQRISPRRTPWRCAVRTPKTGRERPGAVSSNFAAAKHSSEVNTG